MTSYSTKCYHNVPIRMLALLYLYWFHTFVRWKLMIGTIESSFKELHANLQPLKMRESQTCGIQTACYTSKWGKKDADVNKSYRMPQLLTPLARMCVCVCVQVLFRGYKTRVVCYPYYNHRLALLKLHSCCMPWEREPYLYMMLLYALCVCEYGWERCPSIEDFFHPANSRLSRTRIFDADVCAYQLNVRVCVC